MYENNNSLLECSQLYIGKKVLVIPVCRPLQSKGMQLCSCRKEQCSFLGKHPDSRLVKHGALDASDDPEITRRWFKGRDNVANIGIKAGYRDDVDDGVWFIDIDNKDPDNQNEADENLRWFKDHYNIANTWTARTGGGGYQLAFRWPNDKLPIADGQNILRPHVDIKGSGYVVVAPSLHRSGKQYEWLNGCSPKDIDLAYAPNSLVNDIRNFKKGSVKKQGITGPLDNTINDIEFVFGTPRIERVKAYSLNCEPVKVGIGEGATTQIWALAKDLFRAIAGLTVQECLEGLYDFQDRFNDSRITDYVMQTQVERAYKVIEHNGELGINDVVEVDSINDVDDIDVVDVVDVVDVDVESETFYDSDILDAVDNDNDNDNSNFAVEHDSFHGSKIDKAAYIGFVGEYLEYIMPHTEAGIEAVLVQLLTYFGSVVGRNPHTYNDKPHHANLYTVLVGDTSLGRKGTSLYQVKKLFENIKSNRTTSGVKSGEAFVTVFDDSSRMENRTKNILLLEEEFAEVLAANNRDNSTLSPKFRTLWDDGSFQYNTSKRSVEGSDYHVALIGHITDIELRLNISESDQSNGFANRIAWVQSSRSKKNPHLKAPDISHFQDRIATIGESATSIGEVILSKEAEGLWYTIYGGSDIERGIEVGRTGPWHEVCARAGDMIKRFALLYALLDSSNIIETKHLKAGYAVWLYCDQTAQNIFGESNVLGQQLMDTIKETYPDGIKKTAWFKAAMVNGRNHKVATAIVETLIEDDMVFRKGDTYYYNAKSIKERHNRRLVEQAKILGTQYNIEDVIEVMPIQKKIQNVESSCLVSCDNWLQLLGDVFKHKSLTEGIEVYRNNNSLVWFNRTTPSICKALMCIEVQSELEKMQWVPVQVQVQEQDKVLELEQIKDKEQVQEQDKEQVQEQDKVITGPLDSNINDAETEVSINKLAEPIESKCNEVDSVDPGYKDQLKDSIANRVKAYLEFIAGKNIKDDEKNLVEKQIRDRSKESFKIAKVYKEQGEEKPIEHIANEVYVSHRPMKSPISNAEVPRLKIEPLPYIDIIPDDESFEYDFELLKVMDRRRSVGLTTGSSILEFRRDVSGKLRLRKCLNNKKRLKGMRVSDRERLKLALKIGFMEETLFTQLAKTSGEYWLDNPQFDCSKAEDYSRVVNQQYAFWNVVLAWELNQHLPKF